MGTGIGAPPSVFLNWCDRLQFMLSSCIRTLPPLWMAVLLLWLLDISNNTAMEPFRAFIADTVPENQQSTGFLMQSVFTGLGITLANISLYLLKQVGWLNQTSEVGIPYWVFGSFYIGAVCSLVLS